LLEASQAQPYEKPNLFVGSGCALLDGAEARATGVKHLALRKAPGFEMTLDLDRMMVSTMLSVFGVFELSDADLVDVRIVEGDSPDAKVRFPGTSYPGIYFTEGMVGGILQQATMRGPALAAILGHEVSHIYQYRHDYWERLTSKGNVVRPAELHADFCAGWSLSRVRFIGPKDLDAIVNIMTTLGDTFFELKQQHHGTPEERSAAVRTGYHSSAMSVAEMARFGELYVTTMGRP